MTSMLTIDARSLGSTFAEDPEFALPARPRFIPEVLVIPYGQNALLFEGGRELQVISGKSARTFLPRLLPLLDGRHTIEELSARFPQLPANAVRDAVVLLYTRGLLEDGDPGEPPPGQDALAAFAGRYCDVTRVSASRRQVLDRLAAARVAVVGNAAGREVLGGLMGHGFRALDLLRAPADLRQDAYDLLVACFSDAGEDAPAWFRAAQSVGIRALHAHIGADAVEIGPYFIPGQSGCYDCMRTLHAAPAQAGGDLPFWSAVVALQASTLLSRLGSVKLYNTCRVHGRSVHGPTYERRSLARLPGCATCGLEGALPEPTHPDLRAWVLHHSAHVMTCKELRSPRDHQIHYAASNLELTRKEPRPRHGVPIVRLPDEAEPDLLPPWTRHVERGSRQRADLGLLGRMLRYAAGYQDTPVGKRRIAASGGGLASCDLFVVARRVSGLEPGAYHYFGYGHCLERIGFVEDGLLAGALGLADAELPPVLVIGTSDTLKTRQKYDEFSFRIGALDSGVACQVLHDVAAAAGLDVVEYPDLRDKVAAHLLQFGTAGNRRMPTFALGIGAPWREGEPPDPLGHHYQTTDQLIELASRLGPTSVRPPPPPPIEVAPHVARPLAALVRARRSHRRFADRPVPAPILRSLARIADDADRRRVHARALAVPMGFWMAVLRGTPEMPVGTYRWDRARGDLLPLRGDIGRAEVLATMQQHGYADAAVACYVTCDFEAALGRFGPRGYREAATRAGSRLARVQLAALGWQVVGSMWGGLAEEGVGRLFGIDRYRDCPMFAASFGFPCDD